MSEPLPYQEVLVDLARHPGWQILEQRVREQQVRDSESLGLALLRSTKPIDPLQVARTRGFWSGQRWLLRQVRHELRAYERVEEKVN